MDDCLFCKIVREEVPADVVERTEDFVAFRDINPVAPTHILIIPTHHITSAADLGSDQAELLGRIFDAASRIARAEGIADAGYRFTTNVGAAAGQSVAHLHFHLLGGRSFSWPPG